MLATSWHATETAIRETGDLSGKVVIDSKYQEPRPIQVAALACSEDDGIRTRNPRIDSPEL